MTREEYAHYSRRLLALYEKGFRTKLKVIAQRLPASLVHAALGNRGESLWKRFKDVLNVRSI